MEKKQTGARLRYVMDPMCSWCWGFAPVVEALAVQAGRDGVALELVAGGLRPGKGKALKEDERHYILGHWRQVNRHTGQPFEFEHALPDGFFYDTEPACRALVTARKLDVGHAWSFVKRLQQAFYVENRDITQPAILIELAEAEGYSPSVFAATYDLAETRQITQSDFNWVQSLGMVGFPTLLGERDGQLALLTHGYQSLEVLSPLLTTWLARGRLTNGDSGPLCGIGRENG